MCYEGWVDIYGNAYTEVTFTSGLNNSALGKGVSSNPSVSAAQQLAALRFPQIKRITMVGLQSTTCIGLERTCIHIA